MRPRMTCSSPSRMSISQPSTPAASTPATRSCSWLLGERDGPRPLLAGGDLLVEVDAVAPEVDLDGVPLGRVVLREVRLLVRQHDLLLLGDVRQHVAPGEELGQQL